MKRYMSIGVCLALFASAACNRQPDVDRVPVGSDIQLTRDDGALLEGTLTSRDEKAVTIDVGPTNRAVPRDEINDVRVKNDQTPVEPPPSARFREVNIPEGTKLAVRLNTTVSSNTSRAEDRVQATLDEPVVIGDHTVIPAGAELRGVVTSAEASGKVKGRASLGVRFDTLVSGDERYEINARFARTAEASTSKDVKKIAIPAAGGAVLGAILGGKKGAAIGAAAGGGAGTAVVLSTTGEDITLPVGTVLSLSIGRPIDVRVPISR